MKSKNLTDLRIFIYIWSIMRENLNRIFAVFMALIVMLSTISFTVDMHYCGNSLVDSSILNNAKTCGMEAMTPDEAGCEIKVPDCCTDKQIVFEGQDELKISFEELSPDQQLFITSYVFTLVNLFEGLEEHVVPFKAYSPPLVVKDIQKLDEVYII